MEAEEDAFSFGSGIKEAFAAIPAGFEGFWASLLDPMGLSGAMSEIEETDRSAYSSMVDRFKSKQAAIAYLLFILIYAPCVAVMASIYREANLGWAAFNVIYLTTLAWLISTTFYQATTFAAHPAQSGLWLGICAGLSAIGYLLLRVASKHIEVKN